MTSSAPARPPVIGHAELPVWVPGEILCASDDLGWHGVSQRSCRYHRQDVDPASFVRSMNMETAAYQPLVGLEAAHA
ncbi:hypothetical protein [Aquincola tertiaricarbonis]|uniref:hypothetical protein n=1 Tax=Aquincola tertiaricarbonis TaxID=391953 RepID=UPI0012ED7219|nr:hypothetical protein [Aquincola tertiaricarbonis]